MVEDRASENDLFEISVRTDILVEKILGQMDHFKSQNLN